MGKPSTGAESSTDDPSNIAAVLFTPVQRRLLGLFFGQPSRWFQSAEVIRLVGAGTGAAHRLLTRLADAGLVETEMRGNQRHYRAHAACPVFAEMRSLVQKTIGVRASIEAALRPFSDMFDAAFVYGSIARGTERAESDVDLLVLSSGMSYADLYAALEPAERALGRPINPTLMTPTEWRRKRKAKDSFVSRIAAQPRLFVIGVEDVAE